MKQHNNIFHNQKGSSLVEKIIIGSIIVVMIATGGAIMTQEMKKSRDARRLSDASEIQKAIEYYYTETGEYPSGSQDFQDVTDLSFLKTLPKDPLASENNPEYQYLYLHGAAYDVDGYEISIAVESAKYLEKARSDGGNDPDRYEIGMNTKVIKSSI